jgi:hypothetical protein
MIENSIEILEQFYLIMLDASRRRNSYDLVAEKKKAMST